MSFSLPPEILDLIVDHLHDQPDTLRACCIVSKSWVPRTRTHLFAHVEFTRESPVGSWAEAFPDPFDSPAHHTRALTIQDHQSTTTTGADAGRWIRTFHNVLHLHVNQHPLAPFHGLSPTVKSLHLKFGRARLSEIFDLMCSFPLLEDFTLVVHGYEDDPDGWTAPSTSPRLTGSLELRSVAGVDPIIRRLLDLPNGLKFTEVVLTCGKETDFKPTTDLVSECSNTLESLGFVPLFHAAHTTTSFNLSTAVKLRRLMFSCGRSGVRWITEALRTVEPKDLQDITLQFNHTSLMHGFEGPVRQQWEDLDRLLVRFWTLHSICPKVVYKVGSERDIRDYASRVMPELARRGLIDLVEYNY